jgi:hypothetical protein
MQRQPGHRTFGVPCKSNNSTDFLRSSMLEIFLSKDHSSRQIKLTKQQPKLKIKETKCIYPIQDDGFHYTSQQKKLD